MKFKVFDNKTGKEADTWNIALHEEWAQGLVYCDMEGFLICEDGALMLADECGHVVYCESERFKVVFEDERPHNGWVKCSDRLPTEDDGERVLAHLSFDKPACEYVYIPWKTVEFEYLIGHIDAWFAIPPFEQSTMDTPS